MLKKIGLVFVLAGVLMVGCKKEELKDEKSASADTTAESTSENNTAPDFQLPDLNGKNVSLKGFRGKTVLLTFWASWCPACRKEIPSVKEIASKYNGKSFEVVTVNVDNTIEAAKDFTQRNNINYLVLFDQNAKVTQSYGVRGIPANFVIDEKGAATFFGPDINAAEGKIKVLLNVK